MRVTVLDALPPRHGALSPRHFPCAFGPRQAPVHSLGRPQPRTRAGEAAAALRRQDFHARAALRARGGRGLPPTEAGDAQPAFGGGGYAAGATPLTGECWRLLPRARDGGHAQGAGSPCSPRGRPLPKYGRLVDRAGPLSQGQGHRLAGIYPGWCATSTPPPLPPRPAGTMCPWWRLLGPGTQG